MIQKETTKKRGIIRLINYKLPTTLFHISRLIGFLGFQKLKTEFVMKFGTMKWDTGEQPNLITNAGLAYFATFAAIVPYIAWGSSSTARSAGQTTLGAEISTSGLQRQAAVLTRTTTNQTNDTSVSTITSSVTGTQTVQEIGLLTAASVGTLIGTALTGSKAMTNGDSLVGIYKIVNS